ncbi:MAG TPA: rod shape-determining protein RodA [Planctomycetota bacterium]|nr:rod shape-determining protein RodA [Planctomycetota bacterium]
MNLRTFSRWASRHLLTIDWLLLAAALAICTIGVAFIWSASLRMNEQTADWHVTTQPMRQVMFLVVSLVAFVAVLVVPYTVVMRFSYLFYVVGIVLLVGVLFQPPIKHVHRWYSLGGFLFQPSEYMKVILIMTLARYLMYRENYRTLRGLLGPFVLTLGPLMLIVRQPDLGTAIVFVPILFALLYVAGARARHLVTVILIGLVLSPVIYFNLADYQQKRLISFLSPAEYAQTGGFQVMNSVCAVASGGLLGKGWSEGTQNLFDFIPADRTDFIFAVLGEEWGFVGTVALLALYFLIFLGGLGIAKSTREPYGRLIAVGVVTLFAMQVFINVGMTIQLMPVTGLPLPFMSYGGSSLLSSFIALGLLINVGKNRIPVLADEDFK